LLTIEPVAPAGFLCQTNARANNPEQSIATPASAIARKPSEANSSRIKVFLGVVSKEDLPTPVSHSARSAVRRCWAAFKTLVETVFGWFHIALIPTVRDDQKKPGLRSTP
jgi:hypothetical protein